MMDQSPPRHPITIKIEGKKYKGTYWIAGKILTVSTGKGGKCRQVGSRPAEDLAAELLRRHTTWLLLWLASNVVKSRLQLHATLDRRFQGRNR